MRYARQIAFQEIGRKGQVKLGKSTIAIIGIGALGSIAAELLARAGVGRLILIDRDIVELTNLQRQVLFREKDVGRPKAVAAKELLSEINSEIKIEVLPIDLNYKNIRNLKADLVLDCTDNLETRFLLNEYCHKNKIPLVSGAAIGSIGTVLNIVGKGPCYRCIFREAPGLETCETAGVLNTVTSVIGAMQANEALKILLKKDHEKKMIRFNAWDNEFMKISVKVNHKCPVHKGKFDYLEGKKGARPIKLCGSSTFQIEGRKIDLNVVKKRLGRIGKVNDYGVCIRFRNIILFREGRVLIKARNEKEARSIYSKYVGN